MRSYIDEHQLGFKLPFLGIDHRHPEQQLLGFPGRSRSKKMLWLTATLHLEDSKSTSGRTLCILGSHSFVPISWMCKKQTAVSHISKESEIISMDTGPEIGWFACTGITGSNCFCFLEIFLIFQIEQGDLLMLMPKEIENHKGRPTC